MDETFWKVEDNVLLTWKMKSDESISLIQHRDKDGFTLALTVSASGKMLKPIIIGKGKTARCLKKFNLPGYIQGCFSKSGWMNENIVKHVIDNVSTFSNGRDSVLVMDKYKSHCKEDVIKYAEEKQVKLIYVPSNLTYLRQPLDVSIYGILKAKSRTFWKKQRLFDINLKPTLANAITRLILSLSFIQEKDIMKAFNTACNLPNL